MSVDPHHSRPAGPSAADGTTGSLLRMRGIVKTFPGVRALDGVDLDVRPGEVHCLLGQNGAGKSTLIKVLAGAHRPDAGEIEWAGEPVTLGTPEAAIARGIATIYQELDLVAGLTVAENIFLGHEKARGGFLRRGETRAAARRLLGRLGHAEIRVDREVGTLPASGQQIVSMARALSHDTRLIVMDEPSAVLDQEEVQTLFRVIRDLTAQGVAVVYISHRLEEIRQIGDRVTVLKDGRTVATDLPARDTPTADLIRLMTGRDIEYVFPQRTRAGPDRRDRARGRRPRPDQDVRRRLLLGAGGGDRRDRRPGRLGPLGDPRDRVRRPPRRPTAPSPSTGSGCAGDRSAPRSAPASGWPPRSARARACCSTRRSTRTSPSRAWAASPAAASSTAGASARRPLELTRSLDVRPAGVDRPVRTLSGGNQQKVVLARWLLRECRVLLLDEPTRGVDVGARSEIYALIRSLADRGVAVVLVSSEVEEVLGLADRVLVVREGLVVHEGPADGDRRARRTQPGAGRK